MTNKKVKRSLSYIAAVIFLFALAINVKVTLDDPFAGINYEAIATGSSSNSSCAAIVTPNGNGTEGAYLLEAPCIVGIIIVGWEATCVWTGDCDDICMFDEENEC